MAPTPIVAVARPLVAVTRPVVAVARPVVAVPRPELTAQIVSAPRTFEYKPQYYPGLGKYA